MPTYDYLCNSCGHEFEKFESMTARPAKKCPQCKKMQLNRLIGAGAGIIFKGSGFYVTDSKGNGSNAASKAPGNGDSPVAANTNGKAEKKTESKPETKVDSKPDSTPAKKKQPAGKK